MECLKIEVKVANCTILPHLPRDSYQYDECYKREEICYFIWLS